MVWQGIRRIFEAEPDLEMVDEADNGEQALRVARGLKPDIIVMEARIGKLDSVEVTKRVKAQHPDAAVIVLTAYDDEEYIADMLRVGGRVLIPRKEIERLQKKSSVEINGQRIYFDKKYIPQAS